MKVNLGTVEITDLERMRIAGFLGRRGDLATREEIKAFALRRAYDGITELKTIEDKRQADISRKHAANQPAVKA